MKKYIPSEIEPKWQKKWAEDKIYQTEETSEKPKKYVLDMFPYPSGEGLHIGHFKIYTSSDVVARFYRASGFNVLHPTGWDAFGLPTENFAIKTGIHPSKVTAQNVANIKKQMQMVGLSYDWDKEINTTDSNYYKWTQWIFLKLFEKGLAYEDEVAINWCPKDKTGLANEEVVGGVCERCGTKVEQKKVRQWILRITKYADRLLEDLEGLDWPEFIKLLQVNWIGRSEGILIKFDELEVFTTRPDTLFGATFVVISSAHPLLNKFITPENQKAVEKYLALVKDKSELERKEEKEKTGVFTGSFVKNPLTAEKIPVWVADYVLMGYGTGAIMAVPAHDQRDFEFAKKYDLEIKEVIARGPAGSQPHSMSSTSLRALNGAPRSLPPLIAAYEEEGIMVNSGEYDGLSSSETREKISDYLEKNHLGKRQINYHLRDWVFSRQRYWGEPIPLVHCQKCGIVAVPDDQLPLTLPDVEKYEPTGTGESPLAAIESWVNTICPKCGGPAKRETNTMPQWAGSCWYYLRFIDPHNNKALVDPKREKYWMPVDWYLGGAEHAVLHLLYARFWHKVLYDLGVVSAKEPFHKLSSVGLVLAEDGRKMSKRWGNVVTPEQVVKEYGADTLRTYETFMGPFENTISWDPKSINGVYNFLQRTWKLFDKVTVGHPAPDAGSIQISEVSLSDENVDSGSEPGMTNKNLLIMHKTIKKVSENISKLRLNTSVAALMEWLNYLSKKEKVSAEEYKTFLLLLAPFAPHITEELWQMLAQNDSERLRKSEYQIIRSSDSALRHSDIPSHSEFSDSWSIHQHSWPKFDNKYLEEEQVTIVVQVNSKVRDTIMIDKDIVSNKEVVAKMALEDPKIIKHLNSKSVEKSVYIPGKLINFVV